MPDFDKALSELARHGLLLQQDQTLPSVVGLIVGGPLASSWWNHPKAHRIFRCLGQMLDHVDVLATRLVAGKVTYLHRRLWPACVAVAMADEPWQRRGLSPEARKLLRQVTGGESVRATGAPAKELQARLLVHAEEVHTEHGQHEVLLRAWSELRSRLGSLPTLTPSAGREELERAVCAIGAPVDRLPWRRPAGQPKKQGQFPRRMRGRG